MDEFNENIWKVAQELGNSERHFNQIQHQYRAMTSAWILALFAGIQYVFSNWGKLPLPSEVVLALIGLAGAVGITQLWNLDIRVYHQLLDACYVEGLKLEEKYSWLPKVRTNMLATQETGEKGVLTRVVWFYLVGNSVALLVATFAIARAAHSLLGFGVVGSVFATCVGVLFVLLWNREIRRESRSPLLEAWFERANAADARTSRS